MHLGYRYKPALAAETQDPRHLSSRRRQLVFSFPALPFVQTSGLVAPCLESMDGYDRYPLTVVEGSRRVCSRHQKRKTRATGPTWCPLDARAFPYEGHAVPGVMQPPHIIPEHRSQRLPTRDALDGQCLRIVPQESPGSAPHVRTRALQDRTFDPGEAALLMAAAPLVVLERTGKLRYVADPGHTCCELRVAHLVEHAPDRHGQYKAERC